MSTTRETKDGWVERGMLPWSELNTSGTILDANGEPIVICLSCEATQTVLTAVNAHATNVELIRKLVEALEDMLERPYDQLATGRARAALAAARKAGVE
jgi:Ethanolamine utilization protein EutJ (predicted chaperonin)